MILTSSPLKVSPIVPFIVALSSIYSLISISLSFTYLKVTIVRTATIIIGIIITQPITIKTIAHVGSPFFFLSFPFEVFLFVLIFSLTIFPHLTHIAAFSGSSFPQLVQNFATSITLLYLIIYQTQRKRKYFFKYFLLLFVQ